MESRKGPKFRKKKKNKNQQRSLAERIMQKREEAAQQSERNSNTSQGSSSLENSSEPKPRLQTTPKDLSEAANTPGSDGHLSPSESVDISHITKDSDQKKRTPTPEPTLSASQSDQLSAQGSAQGPPRQNSGLDTQPTDSKHETANNIQSSYQKPLQPAYAPYQSENSLPNQSKSPQQSQHQIPQQQPSSGTSSQKQVGPQSGIGRDTPVTSNHITTSIASSSSSPSSLPVKGMAIAHASSSTIPPGGNAAQEGTNPSSQQTHPLPQPQDTNSNYNQYMSLAQKIVLQRQIVAVCDSVTRQQPEQNGGLEANPENTEESQVSTTKKNDQFPQKDIEDIPVVKPGVPVSGQEPCPLSDKKCPIHSATSRNSSEGSKELNQQENLNEYRSDTPMRQTPQTVDNQTINTVKDVPVTEPNKTYSSGMNENQQPEKSRNGFVGKSPKETLPTDPANEDLNSMNHSELEALEKMVDQDLQSLVSGTNSEENTPVINKDLKNKVSENQQPEKSRNGFVGKSPKETLPTDPANEDLNSMNHSELEALEKMVDQDLQSLVSGTNSEENTPVINKDLKNKVLSEEFQRKIDRFLNDI